MQVDLALVHVARMENLADEVQQSIALRDQILKDFKKHFSLYQRKKISYQEYEQKLQRFFGEKTKEEWLKTQNAYITGMLRKMDFFNKQVFFRVYSESVIGGIAPPKPLQIRPPYKREKKKVERKLAVEEEPREFVELRDISRGRKKVVQEEPVSEKKKEASEEHVEGGFEELFEELEA